ISMRTKIFTWLLFATTALLNFATATQMVAQTSSNTKAVQVRAAQSYSRLPLMFETNQGQTDPEVRFLSRGRGYTAFLTSGGMVLSLRPAEALYSTKSTSNATAKIAAQTTLQFNLVGSANTPTAIVENPLSGRVNYFIGNDRTKWRTNVQTYGQVRFKN